MDIKTKEVEAIAQMLKDSSELTEEQVFIIHNISNLRYEECIAECATR